MVTRCLYIAVHLNKDRTEEVIGKKGGASGIGDQSCKFSEPSYIFYKLKILIGATDVIDTMCAKCNYIIII